MKKPLLPLMGMIALFLPGLAQAAEAVDLEVSYQSREEIPERYKWNMGLFYSSWEAWEADMAKMVAMYGEVGAYEGRLAEGPEVVLEVMTLLDRAGILLDKVWGYAGKAEDLDTRDNSLRARMGELWQAYSGISAGLSWLNPEILTIPEATMSQWIDETDGLEEHRFGLLETYRTGKYTLDKEGEEILNLHQQVRGTPRDIFASLTSADGERPEVTLANGEKLVVTPGVYGKALNVYQNPVDRRTIQMAWMKQFDERQNTFASIYNGVIQQGWALAQSRGYESTLAMKLNRNDIPEAVVTSLVQTARSGAKELQRYHNLRKEFLGLEAYGWSDMFVSLLPSTRQYSYDEIVPWIVDSVALLGEEYQSKTTDQFAAGYIDVYETPGKTSGAYNSGNYGVGSFILLNYQGTLEDVFTVAHEMGHSMHTRLAHDYQPYSTSHSTIFVAEVASTLNEKLLLQKLLKDFTSPKDRIAFLEQQIDQIRGTFFLQTMMADFEIEAHRLVEQGEGITAERLTSLWRETVSAYFGDVIPQDDPYMHSWARIPHLYNSPFYVYQYATCFASSSYLMKQMQEDPSTVDRYLELLKSGGNDNPMNQLRKAGVDLTNPEIVKAIIEEFSTLVDLLEKEYSRYLEASRVG